MKLSKIFPAVLLTSSLISCGGEVNPLDGGSEADKEENSGGGITASTLSDLGLSSALAVELPSSVAAKGTELALLNAKSREACEIRNTVKDGLQAIQQVGSMLCHFEVEPEIKFGEKINVTFTGVSAEDMGGAESFQIWVDNSKSDKLTVFFCEDKKLQEKIVVEGASDGRARGYVISHGSEDGSTWGRSAKFDNGFTSKDITKLLVKDTYTNSGDSEAFRRLLRLRLDYSDVGINLVQMAEKGSWEGQEFQNRGAAMIGPKYGMAVYQGQGTDPENNVFSYTHKAFFDAAGLKVEPSVTKDFSQGGGLFVADNIVPGFLTKESAPDQFAADDWDCTGTTVDIQLNPESDAHLSCDSDRDDEWENCWEYEEGVDHQDEFDESAVQDGDNVDL